MAIEAKRGCGYRKVGGIYLVSGKHSEPCHRLPIPLHVCPTCHGGIKQSRGWTWVESAILGGNCESFDDHRALHCTTCPTCTPKLLGDHVGLIWIGEKFYPTPADFMREGIEQGISRRVSKVPRNFKLGESWVILGHPKAVPTECVHSVDGPSVKGCKHEIELGSTGFSENGEPGYDLTKAAHITDTPGIFTAFKPIRIEKLITKSQATPETLEELAKKHITPVVVPDDDKDHQGSVYDKKKSDDDELFDAPEESEPAHA